jgi:hypothetical protein
MGGFFSGVSAWFASHRKTVAAVVAPAVVVVDTLLTGGVINWPVTIGTLLAALGVYAFPNSTPPAPAPPAKVA